jgi:acyl-coenzyme A thioesterase PaaI-like protein
MVDANEHASIDPLVQVAQVDHPDAVGAQRVLAGQAIRDIGHAMVGHHASIELLCAVTDELNDLVERLQHGELRSRAEVRGNGDWGSPPGDGEEMTTYDERPITGRASPWGLDPVVRRHGDEVVATVTLRAAHEGAPGRSHGGIVAALFDDVFGFVLALQQQPGFTGQLTIRYEQGIPIGVPLACRVRLDGRERRKLMMSGELTVVADGSVVARSTATFIGIDRSHFLKMAGVSEGDSALTEAETVERAGGTPLVEVLEVGHRALGEAQAVQDVALG